MDNTFLLIKLVIFSVISGKLKVFSANNQLPVGDINQSKLLDESAELLFRNFLQLDLKDIYFEQLYTFSSNKPLDISVVYYFLVPDHKIYSKKDDWITIDEFKISKEDQEIIHYAVQRLRWKIEYTNAVYSLLPSEFTFSQLQNVYEAILGRLLDKRNFRKKIVSLGIIKPTGHIKHVGPARPAEMFSFKERKLNFVQIL